MVKTAEFGQPTDHAPEPGKCRICGCLSVRPCQVPVRFNEVRLCAWADETMTLCDNPGCIAAARAELTTDPAEADELRRPYEGKRYGFAPRGRGR